MFDVNVTGLAIHVIAILYAAVTIEEIILRICSNSNRYIYDNGNRRKEKAGQRWFILSFAANARVDSILYVGFDSWLVASDLIVRYCYFVCV